MKVKKMHSIRVNPILDTIFWTKTASKGFELLGGVIMLINAM